MFVILTPGVDFTKVLQAPFRHVDPKHAKKQSSHLCLFVLLGSKCIKAACKHVGEIDPWLGTTDIKCNLLP